MSGPGKDSIQFPFSRIVGRDQAKRALLLALVNPAVGGVLLAGEGGTGKTTLIRSLGPLLGKRQLFHLPLHITPEQLLGSRHSKLMPGLSLSETGLLARAQGQLLYIEGVNRLRKPVADCLLAEEPGKVAPPLLLATMDPREGELSPQLLDRFGLYVAIKASENLEERKEIVERQLAFEKDPSGQACREEEAGLADLIEAAARRLKGVKLTEQGLEQIAGLCREAGCQGHRGDLMTAEAARAIAALEGASLVVACHVEEAARYTLPHRMGRYPEPAQPEKREAPAESRGEKQRREAEKGNSPEGKPQGAGSSSVDPPSRELGSAPGQEQEVLELPRALQLPSLLERLGLQGRQVGRRSLAGSAELGKRGKGRLSKRAGAMIGARPTEKAENLALDATIRAAVPFQPFREKGELAIVIRPEDWQEKKRIQKQRALILFLVDASGSMGAQKRMGVIKGVVISLLEEAYRKRDRVSLISFRGKEAQLLLEPTASVERAKRQLQDLRTGGRTPLAAGLHKAYEVFKRARLHQPESLLYLVLISDGKANESISPGDPWVEAEQIGACFAEAGVQSLLFDTENGYIRFGFLEKLAGKMNARYLKVDRLSITEVSSQVKELLNEKE